MFEMYKKERKIENLQAREYLRYHDPIGQYRWEINAWVINRKKNVFLVKFEELRKNPHEIFQKLFKYLNVDQPILIKDVNKLVATSDKVKRPRGKAFGWRATENAQYKIIISEINKKLGREISLLGY